MFAKNKTDKMQIKSAWTPLTNSEANTKMFDERRTLVNSWFGKWSDQQRKLVLQDIISLCKLKQIEFAGELINQRRPVYHEDFTQNLPRVISVYIFSFLDPRSLSRCAQVCWHWKQITELDNLWMPKCVRFSWLLPFSPSPYEMGVWKRLYIENVSQLRAYIPKDVKLSDLVDVTQDGRHSARSNRRTPRPGSANKQLPPWRGSDPIPKDIWRNNYLANEDEVDKINRLRKKGVYGKESESLLKTATTKVNSGAAKRSSSVPRSQSSPQIANLGISNRPDWAKVTLHTEGSPAPVNSTVKRPGPMKAVHPVSSNAQKMRLHQTSQPAGRPHDMDTHRSNGHTGDDLFSSNPWNIPNADYDSDT